MKNKVVKAFSFLLISMICITTLCGCGRISNSEAKATVEAFFAEIKKPDYEAAASYFHSEAEVDGSVLKDLFEKQLGIDPTKLESISYNGFRSNSQIGAASVEFSIAMVVDSADYTVSVTVAENHNDYSISYIHIALNNTAETGNGNKTNI